MSDRLRSRSDFPCSIRHVENIWIPMRDGKKLAGRLWLPDTAQEQPVPAILEYIPYRKRDFTRIRDSMMHPYVAGHGFACVRVDLRGSGDSDGVLTDEYLPQELEDGCAVIAWLAEQPWCNGKVGMIGISWGGFNGLQIAAMRPQALRAVISVCSTDDRYSDDIHHMGGCLLGDNLSWASVMFSYNSLPPDPLIVGDRWREMWHQRLNGSGLWLETWMRHQRRDEYWRHGSICEDYSAIECPVMAVSGWADGYSNAVFRLLEHLRVPRKGLIGPWSHKYPHIAAPGPAIGFLQESLRWWDTWLKEKDRGVLQEPMFRVWMQDSVPPTSSYEVRPGRWVAEPEWPSPNIRATRFVLAQGGLRPLGEQVAETEISIQSPLTVGLFAGKWCSYAAGPDLAHDQRQEDGGALVFDSEPLNESLEILGSVKVDLDLSSNEPLAMIALRLSDVAADGKATRVTYGLANLTHRCSAEHPDQLERGQSYRVSVALNHVAQVLPAGHRIRIALSTSYWPLAWPPPKPVELTIQTGNFVVELPVRQRRPEDAELRPFERPESAVPDASTILEPEHHNWLVHRDLADDVSTLEVINDKGLIILEDINLEVENRVFETYSSRADDFTSVRGETKAIRRLRRGDWEIKTVAQTILTCSETHFRIDADLDAYEADSRVFCRSWQINIPRDYV